MPRDRSLNAFSLEGKVALVTGASRGLGRAIAEGLASAGADVVCSSSRPGGARDTTAAIRALGRKAWELDADVSDRAALLAMADAAEREAGAIHILANNAGTIRRAPAADYSFDDWDHVLRTNLDSVFVLSQRLGRRMIERRAGKIINIASLLSFTGGVLVPAYTASKHAIAGLTKALANEWAPHGIQVNGVAPGYFITDNTQELRDTPAKEREITSRIPAGRWGNPSDVAGAVVFLASAASDYVNGHILTVDGGWSAR